MNKTATAEAFHRRYDGAFAVVRPKYLKLRGMLEAALDDGLWGEGDRIATEHELARATGCSLGTVQRAILDLVREGRLNRVAGRGTFVLAAKYHLGEPFLNARFLNDDESGILPVDASMIGSRRLRGTGPWVDALRLRTGEAECIERVLDVNREFNVLSRFYVDAARFPKFVDLTRRQPRSANLKRLLAKTYRLPQVTHSQTIRFLKFAPDICRRLRCRGGTEGVLQSVTATIQGGDAVYYHELFIPPNERALQLPDIKLSGPRG